MKIHKKSKVDVEIMLSQRRLPKQGEAVEENNVGVQEGEEDHEGFGENQEEEILEENRKTEEKIEDVLERLGLSKFQEVFAKEEIDLEVFKASSALELKTILNIPFGKIKLVKMEVEKMVEKGFLCPFCENNFVSAESLQSHIEEKHQGGYGGENVTLNETVSNDEMEVSNSEIFQERREEDDDQNTSLLQDIRGEEPDAVEVTLEEECDISMASMNETNEEVSNNGGDISMKSMNCDDSITETNDLTDVSMNETLESDDDLAEELENKEKIEKLKLLSHKLLYSEDEAEQVDLAEKMKNVKVTAEQIKISGAGFILENEIIHARKARRNHQEALQKV